MLMKSAHQGKEGRSIVTYLSYTLFCLRAILEGGFWSPLFRIKGNGRDWGKM